MSVSPILKPLLGRHLASFVITGLTEGSGGALTPSSSSVTCTGRMQGYEETWNREVKNITSINSIRKNMVPLEDSHGFLVEVIEVNDGVDPAPLKSLLQGFDYLLVQFQRGTSPGRETVSAYCTWSEMTSGMKGKGGQIMTLRLEPIDVGEESYTRSVS